MASRKSLYDDRHYSGEASKPWWKRVNRIGSGPRRAAAYGIACALQDMEQRLLRLLDEIERGSR